MVTDATHLFVGFALAGPELPEVLARLTSWDPASLAEGEATGAPIGDVRAVVVRRDLPLPVLEAYVATEFARYAWETVLDAVSAGGRGAGRLARAPRRGVVVAMHPIRYFRPWRMWRRPELKPTYDVVIVGGGAHGLAIAYELAKRGITKGRGPGEELHRRRRLGSQHHDHPRQLPDARGRGLLQAGAQAVRAPRAGARLQPAVLAAGPPHARPCRARGERRPRARRGEPPPGRRLPRDLPRRDPNALPAARPVRSPRVPDHGGAVPPAGRRDPPRRGRVGLRPAGGPDGRRDPPGRRGDRRRGRRRPGHRGLDVGRRRLRTGGRLGHGRLDLRDRPDGGGPGPDHDAPAAGLRDRAAQAVPRTRSWSRRPCTSTSRRPTAARC